MDNNIIFKRKVYNQLLDWKNNHTHQYALFLNGARRVGKTTIAKQFGMNEYKSYVIIDFREANDDIKDLFYNSLLDLDHLFNIIQLTYKVKLYKRESLVIFDEIQLFPQIRQALKTFLVDGRYDYIETGSLAGIRKKVQEENLFVPSEEYSVKMYPLDFEEFLWANDDLITMDILRNNYSSLKPFGDSLNRLIMKKFREYMCVGGMPSAVSQFVNSKDYELVDFEKNSILNLYRNDIVKQKDENPNYVGNILDNLPSELFGESYCTFQISHIEQNARMREYHNPLSWLEDAMIINIARCTNDPSVALTLNYEKEKFKCYLLDTGLLINLSFKDTSFLENDTYRAILSDKLHLNEGMFLENMVCQCLVSNGHKPIFYLEMNEDHKPIMEIDFLIRKEKKVIPIEVKSSKHFTTLSLDKFKKKFTNRIGLQYILYDGDIRRENEKIFLPYYVASIL